MRVERFCCFNCDWDAAGDLVRLEFEATDSGVVERGGIESLRPRPRLPLLVVSAVAAAVDAVVGVFVTPCIAADPAAPEPPEPTGGAGCCCC